LSSVTVITAAFFIYRYRKKICKESREDSDDEDDDDHHSGRVKSMKKKNKKKGVTPFISHHAPTNVNTPLVINDY
jgi:hypothetical protein